MWPDISETSLLYNCALCCVPMTKGCVHVLYLHVLTEVVLLYSFPLPLCMCFDSLEALPIYVFMCSVLMYLLCGHVLVLLECACVLISEVMERLPPALHLRSRSLSRMVSVLYLTHSWSSSTLSFIIYILIILKNIKAVYFTPSSSLSPLITGIPITNLNN